jgi:hypothetical protein
MSTSTRGFQAGRSSGGATISDYEKLSQALHSRVYVWYLNQRKGNIDFSGKKNGQRLASLIFTNG